jgi:hypothetical protein
MATRLKAKPRQKRSSGVSKVAPNLTAPALSYRDLAWWAETADGSRDENLVIADVQQNGSVRRVVKKRDDALKQRDSIVVDGIRTDSTVKGRLTATRVTIEVAGETIECKSEDGMWCDSIFCGESAIEKFLFPYYHAQRLLTRAEWDKLEAAFRNPFTVAIGHVHPSNAFALAGGGGAAGSFYSLAVKPGADGVRAKVKWESIIP